MNKNFNEVVALAIALSPKDCPREVLRKLTHCMRGMKSHALQFDAYEVHPVVATDKESYEQASNIHDPAICAWGLYGHLDGRGITWINDFSTQANAGHAMQLLETAAGTFDEPDVINTSEHPEVDPETVTLIASGYEFICPHCETYNRVIETTEKVTCEECGHTFIVDESIHAHG